MDYKPTNGGELRRRQKSAFTDICFTGLIIGCGLLMYPIAANVFARVISSSERLYDLYKNLPEFAFACESVYTLTCVFLPFLICLLLFRGSHTYNGEIPLNKPVNVSNAALLIVFGFGICFIANYITNNICELYKAAGLEYYSSKVTVQPPKTVTAALMMYLSTAVTPALFEEFALRGVVLQSLRRYGDWFAIIVSSVLFALMHGNAVQVPFALLVGLMLGYVAVATGSLWPGIIIHFLNNSVSVTSYVLMSFANIDTANRLYGFLALFMPFAGTICFAVFLVFNGNVFRLKENTEEHTHKKVKYVLLMPTMIAGTAYLLFRTLTDFVAVDQFFKNIFNL